MLDLITSLQFLQTNPRGDPTQRKSFASLKKAKSCVSLPVQVSEQGLFFLL
jgi:hypothetical protein